jgi:hypothetical protein
MSLILLESPDIIFGRRRYAKQVDDSNRDIDLVLVQLQ